MLRVRFLSDNYVGDFPRFWFKSPLWPYFDPLFCRNETFNVGQTVYASPRLADELTIHQGRPTEPWERAEIICKIPWGRKGAMLKVRFADGYEKRLNQHWFYPKEPDWLK